MKDENIIVIREGLGIGWLGGMNYLNLSDSTPLKLRSYNGCLCFIIQGKRLGYKSWKDRSITVNRVIKNDCPF